jgi:heterodisulfide reductase subunit A
MYHIIIVGGGLAGCAAAVELAQSGAKVTIIEKSGCVGGKVRDYGCKATDKCNNCGVCLAGGLWEKVEKNPGIDILYNSKLIDVTGDVGDFSIVSMTPEGLRYINGIAAIIVATGFEESSAVGGHLQIDEGTQGISRGLQLESICKTRGKSALFEKAPERVAFIQCVGSRDKKESALYCSRVCCSYSTRAALVIRHIYPECEIVFFYMELQSVSSGDYFAQLKEKNIEFIKCRPLKVKAGTPVKVIFETPDGGELNEREFDLVVLSDGIHPPKDADRLAEICGLAQDSHGFLRSIEGTCDSGSEKCCVVSERRRGGGDGERYGSGCEIYGGGEGRRGGSGGGEKDGSGCEIYGGERDGRSGIYVAGCAKQPSKIEEAYSDAVAVARQALFALPL